MVLIEDSEDMVIIEEMEDVEEKIPAFYAQRSIFITGATGFFGKVLIEKLLRSCPDVNTLYILIRDKKGKDMETRVDEMFDEPMFANLKTLEPTFRDKIVSVYGDCSLPGLGIAASDKEKLIQNVSVVFHGAATVRFDEKIKLAVGININGTKEIINLCREMINLKALVHVSTSYSNSNLTHIDEICCPPGISGDNIIKLTEILDDNVLDNITPQLIGNWPNTYTFTKCIAENLVIQNGKGLPVAIVRPGIVTGSVHEPIPGWIDNLYGPTGLVMGVGLGIVRTILIDQDKVANMVPVDICVNSIIASAWDLAQNNYDEPPIYNVVSTCRNSITWRSFFKLTYRFGEECPPIKAIWCYNTLITSHRRLFQFLIIVLHIWPAYIIDFGRFFIGKEPKLKKAYTKIHKFLNIAESFSLRSLTFTDNNLQNLWRRLTKADQKKFYFEISDLDWEEYVKNFLFGIRIFLLKDDLKTIPAAKRKFKRFVIAQNVMFAIFGALLLWMFYYIFSIFV